MGVDLALDGGHDAEAVDLEVGPELGPGPVDLDLTGVDLGFQAGAITSRRLEFSGEGVALGDQPLDPADEVEAFDLEVLAIAPDGLAFDGSGPPARPHRLLARRASRGSLGGGLPARGRTGPSTRRGSTSPPSSEASASSSPTALGVELHLEGLGPLPIFRRIGRHVIVERVDRAV